MVVKSFRINNCGLARLLVLVQARHFSVAMLGDRLGVIAGDCPFPSGAFDPYSELSICK